MKRRLITSNDATRHPFRQGLPLAAITVATPWHPDRKGENIRLFLMTFTAAFLAISGFIW
jgi:RNA polymerase sigma factor (sigma-70 family)